MRDAGSTIRIIAAFLTLMILAVAWFGGHAWMKTKGLLNPIPPPIETILSQSEVVSFQPGRREFDRALELIALGRVNEGRKKLALIQKLYASTTIGPEAVRILGEINIDELLSVENLENKVVHTVSAGQGYLSIVNKHDTSYGCLMFLNGLMDLGPLHVGDEFLVLPLNFRLEIDVKGGRIVLLEEGAEGAEGRRPTFVKEYPIVQETVGNLGRTVRTVEIGRKHGELESRTYHDRHSRFRHADKVLGFQAGRHYLQIRPLPDGEVEEVGRSFYLARPDMEELAMLIRPGNEVEVRPAG